MAPSTQSLWSPDIRPDVLSPYEILKAQAEALAAQTNGLLVGEVSQSEGESGTAQVHLDIVVPALRDYRHRILTATYRADMPYPVWVAAKCFATRNPDDILGNQLHTLSTLLQKSIPLIKQKNEAASDQEFYELVSKVLKSDEVKAVAVSLLAKAGEVLRGQRGEDGTESGEGLG